MSVKLTLQNLSDWIADSAKAAKGAADLTLESGLLKDSLGELSELGGITGALFKLGSRAIPDPTPEQRIAARLHRTFLTAFDRELKDRPDLVSPKVWRDYIRIRLPKVATEKLSGQFTWLSIFGSSGRKPGRSWPIVGELSDLGRTWVAEMVTAEGNYGPDLVQRTADDVRGRLHEALSREIDSLLTEPAIRLAIDEARPRATRDALDLLAQELTTLRRYRLFGEIPQDAVYIPSRVKVVDLKEAKAEIDWSKVDSQEGGDQILFDAIRISHPRLFVLEGEMGVGKSCLMRLLASQLAEQYRSDRRQAPVYFRWRDIYEQADLVKAIADQLNAEYGLPFSDLPDQADILYLVDGFDEMSSHQEGYVTQCFERLARLVAKRCSVVVAMRSTVISPGLRLAWKNREAVAVQIQDFDESAVDAWVEKWRAHTKNQDVTGERLRELGGEEVASNPLLLYMVAKFVDPAASGKQGSLTRTEVFRIFVDETIQGKLRTSREDFPFSFPERDYRLLLQEMAYLASWPRHAPKCPARVVREQIPESFLKDLNFQDVRTAFVLHFFEPGDLAGNEFEFQPEGFRQYLLAEWCVRTQLDALRDERRPSHPLARTRDQAIDALAQFPVKGEERFLLNEVYEELGHLTTEDGELLASRLASLGVSENNAPRGSALIQRLYDRLRADAEEPPARSWEDNKVGIPEGQEIPPGLNSFRLLFNYWDQCMLATLGLYRGLKKNPASETIFDRDVHALGSFCRSWYVVRGHTWQAPLNLSQLSLQEADLAGLGLQTVHLTGTDLAGADLDLALLENAHMSHVRLRKAFLRLTGLIRADLRRADLTQADLWWANFFAADLTDADLTGADMKKANLAGANLAGANLAGAKLPGANLAGASLAGANLAGAGLTGANLTGANLAGADLTGADLAGAQISPEQLKQTNGTPRRFPDGSKPPTKQ